MIKSFYQKLCVTLDMIKFQHSIFALPFALASVFFATDGRPQIRDTALIILCMITARNAAMTFNRIVDRDIDARNPRTQNRPIPQGLLSTKFCTIFCVINCTLFVLISSFFNPLTLLLSPLALAIVLGYSLTKRFTHFTQFFLGLALGSSPLAAWIALRGELTLFPSLIGLGVFFWVAGFDLIYSSQDHDFDKSADLKNIVVKIGVKKSLLLSKIFHILCVVFFVLAGAVQGLQDWYFFGTVVMGGFLVYEHSLLRHDDLSKVDMAFFTLNGYVALSFFVFSLLEIYS